VMACVGGKHARDIYKYLSMALDRTIQHSRYDMPRSALQLLAKHACQWDQCIIDDYEAIVNLVSHVYNIRVVVRCFTRVAVKSYFYLGRSKLS